MTVKLKTLIFSTTFLTHSAFSAHATDGSIDRVAEFEKRVLTQTWMNAARVIEPVVHDQGEKEQVFAFCKQYNFSDWLIQDVYHEVKGKAFNLNKYGVPHLDYTAALLFYNKRRVSTEFGLLFDLFTKTPVEYRKNIWENLVAFEAYRSTGSALYEFSYGSDGKVYISPYKLEGTVSLKDKLFALPHIVGNET